MLQRIMRQRRVDFLLASRQPKEMLFPVRYHTLALKYYYLSIEIFVIKEQGIPLYKASHH